MSFQIAAECKTPHLAAGAGGALGRSLGSIEVALLRSASFVSHRCTSCLSRARVARVRGLRAFEQHARGRRARGGADWRAPAPDELGEARLSQAVELDTEEGCHQARLRLVKQVRRCLYKRQIASPSFDSMRLLIEVVVARARRTNERETSGRDSQGDDFIRECVSCQEMRASLSRISPPDVAKRILTACADVAQVQTTRTRASARRSTRTRQRAAPFDLRA